MAYKNKEDKNACQQRYQKRHRDRQNKWQRDWYNRNKEKESLRKQDQRTTDPIGYILSRIKSKAKREGREFNLSREDIVIPEICPVLLIPLKFGPYKERWSSPSVDRIDNSRGYTKDNVAIISFKANMYKSNMSKEDIKRLYDYVSDI